MNILVFPIILGLCIFVVFPAQAQLVVYDDFSGPFVDIARWYHRHSGTSDNVWPFEGGFRIQKGKLNYFSRAYGTKLATQETQDYRRRLFLKDVSGVTAIETSIQMAKNGNVITGCSENTKPSETRVNFGGSFFNNGSGLEPNNGDYTGDVYATIALYKFSDSTDIPAGYMGVRARVRLCTNEDCSMSSQLYETFFKDDRDKPLLLKVGKKEKFRITYDRAANAFTFQVGKNVATYTSTVENVQPSGALNGGMRLAVDHSLANCPTSNRAIGWADAFFDYISIRQE